MGCLGMKNKTIIKTKKSYSKREKNNIFLRFLFLIISLTGGFLISFWGNGRSYIETELITAIISLFGFSLTATVFVYQALEKKQSSNTKVVISALSNTLRLTLCLAVASLIFDFMVSIEIWDKISFIAGGLKYTTLIYSTICQFDILNAFIVIIKSDKNDEGQNSE